MLLQRKTFWSAVLAVGIGAVLFFTFYDYLTGRTHDGFGTLQKAGVWVGVALILIAGYFLRAWLPSVFMFVFAVGFFLFCLNLYGEFVSTRSPRVYEGSDVYGQLHIPERYMGDGRDQLEITQDEAYTDYAYRLTDRVHALTVHIWESADDYTEYNHQIPLHENYLLWFLSYLEPSYQYYEFCDPYKAIERGVVICSQAAKAVVGLWESQTQLQARNVVLEGHVVAEVQMERDSDLWWVLDADFGVVLEHSAAELESEPELIIQQYEQDGYDEQLATRIARFYGKDGNYIQTNKGVCAQEQSLYWYKWVIPIALVASSLIYFGSAWMVTGRFRPSRAG